MPLYSFGVSAAIQWTTTSQPILEFRATQTDWAVLKFLEIAFTGAPSHSLGIGTPAVMGVGPKSVYQLVPNNPSDPLSSVVLANEWDKPPTAPARYLRRFVFSTGAGQVSGPTTILYFKRGLTIPRGSALVLWLLQGGGSSSMTAVWFNVEGEIDG